MPLFVFSTRFVLLSALLVAMIAHALIVGSVGVEARTPTTRQSPLDVAATCGDNEFATLTYQGIVCASATDTWTNECDDPSDCCNSGEFLKITPTGLACFPLTDRTSTYTTYCADCCGVGEFAVLTTLGLRCVGSPCERDSDCAAPTPACDTAVGRCVQCTQDSHCSTSSFCDTTNQKCEPCSWSSVYTCSGNRRVRHCTVAGVAKKTEYLSCPAGQQCSDGSCGTTPTPVTPTVTACSWQAQSCGTRVCGSQIATCGPADCTGGCTIPNRPGIVAQPGQRWDDSSGCGSCSGGKVCNASGQCVTSCTPADGGWSAWGVCGCTSSTSDSATAGIQYRTCSNPSPACGGSSCVGSSSRSCTTSRCATAATACSWQAQSCGTRVCGSQIATCGPADCTGTCDGRQPGSRGTIANGCGSCSGGKTCSNGSCVAACDYSPACASLTQTQTSTSTSNCGATRTRSRSTACNGGCSSWGSWSSWSGGTKCSGGKTCSSGQCVTPTPTTRVDGGWSAWGSCVCTSDTSDGNAGTQTRICNNPYPSGGGSACSGSSTQSCTTSGCPTGSSCTRRVDGGWSSWSSCVCTSDTSDGNAGTQTRSCTNPAPSCGGSACSGSSEQSCTASGCASGPTTYPYRAPAWSCPSGSTTSCGNAITPRCSQGQNTDGTSIPCPTSSKPNCGTGTYCSSGSCSGVSCYDSCAGQRGTPGVDLTNYDYCNDYANPKWRYFFIDDDGDEVPLGYQNAHSSDDGNKVTACGYSDSHCPSTTRGGQRFYDYDVDVTWTDTACTQGSDCDSDWSCLEYSATKNNSGHTDPVYYCGDNPNSGSAGRDCRCAKYSVNHCWYSCAYRYTVFDSQGGSKVRYYSAPTGLTQAYHGGRVEFTCAANWCSYDFGGDVDGLATVVVGKTDQTDCTDGCSQGVNENLYTGNSCTGSISWTCRGKFGGADDSTTDTPYRCSSLPVANTVPCGETFTLPCTAETVVGTKCDDGKECKSGVCQEPEPDCDANQCGCGTYLTPWCSTLDHDNDATTPEVPGAKFCYCAATRNNKCVKRWKGVLCDTGKGETCSGGVCSVPGCSSHSDCGSAEYCDACNAWGNSCSGGGECKSCTWGNKWCSPTSRLPPGAKEYIGRSCKVGGDTKRYEKVEECTGTTPKCSGGSCVAGCSSHSDCGSAEYCDACSVLGTCSGTGICKSCSWGNLWCNPDNKSVRQSCRSGGTGRRIRKVEECTGTTPKCSGGSCVE